MDELSLAVVSLDFPNADDSDRQFEMALSGPGVVIFLERGPTNRADLRVVMVACVACRMRQSRGHAAGHQ